MLNPHGPVLPRDTWNDIGDTDDKKLLNIWLKIHSLFISWSFETVRVYIRLEMEKERTVNPNRCHP